MIGVLALQGAFDAHRRALTAIDIESKEVRSMSDLAGCDGLIIPGGESTTISKLLVSSGLDAAIKDRVNAGLAVLGTCAGAILLGANISDGRSDQICFGAIDIDTVRNGYGRQLQSFEAELELGCDPESDATTSTDLTGFRATFIRAPKIKRVGEDVRVLGTYEGEPVWCQQETVMVTTFHPELGTDTRIHQAFIDGLRALESKSGNAEFRGAS